MKPILLLPGILCFSTFLSAAASSPPNVVFICTDQQRIDDLSAAGNPYVKTPALDALAARGVRFTRSYCTQPLCSPSRATHVSSRMPYEIGINGNSLRLPESLPTLGTLFKAAGYRTAWTGKWHLPSSYPTQPDEIPGFEILPGNGGADAAAPAKGKAKRSAGKQGKSAGEEEGGRGSQADPPAVKAALRFLQQKPAQPFLLVVSLLNPHDICGFTQNTPARLALPTDPSRLPPAPLNVNAPDRGPQSGNRAPGSSGGKQNSGVEWNDLTWRQQLYHYYQLTEQVDKLIGSVVDALRQAGVEDNTLILFTSDHGEMAGAHHRIRKMSLYEEAMAVPFIVAGPGVPRGVVDQTHMVSGLDVLPTLCDFAGIAAPPQARGSSVRSIMNNPGAPWRDAVFGALGATGGRMVRTTQYKYNLYAANQEELFDLQADPGEMKNLAGDPSLTGVLEANRQRLREWMATTGDTFGKSDAAAPRRGGKKQ
jgi:arylsulfatase A-like enzyme